jgi:hypothetical protein
MAEEQRPEEVQRWTAKRRAALVISLLKSETTAAEAARRHGLKLAEVETAAIVSCSGPRTHCAHGPRRMKRYAKRSSTASSARSAN